MTRINEYDDESRTEVIYEEINVQENDEIIEEVPESWEDEEVVMENEENKFEYVPEEVVDDEVIPVVTSSIPTEQEMDEEYKMFCDMIKKEKDQKINQEAKDKMMLKEWCNENGVPMIASKFQEQFQMMLNDKKRRREIAEEKERLKRVEEAKALKKAQREQYKKAKQERERPGMNAKGKLQGVKKVAEKGLGRRAKRRVEQEKFEKTKVVIEKPRILEPIKFEDEVEEVEEVLEVAVYTAPEVVPEPKIVAPEPTPEVKEDQEWSVVKTKGKKTQTEKRKEEEKKIVTSFFEPTKPVETQTNKTEWNNKTRMCKSVLEGTVCKYGSKCMFAHELCEIRKTFCKFDSKCILVKAVGSTLVNSRNDKYCQFWHTNESEEEYARRNNIPMKPKKLEVSTPIKVQTPVQLKPEQLKPEPNPVPLSRESKNPWGKVEPKVQPNPVQPKPVPKEFVPSVKPVESTITIRTSLDKLEEVTKMVARLGLNIRIELI
jgi:hypothetical protein